MSIEALVAVLYSPPPAGTREVSALDVFRVWCVIAEHARPDGSGACISQRAIADDLGIKVGRANAAIAALREQDRIVKTADARARVRGAEYSIVCDLLERDSFRDSRRTRSGISDELVPATRSGDSFRGLVPGSPGIKPEPEPVTPPTPPSEHGAAAAADTAAAVSPYLDREARLALLELNGASRQLIGRGNVHELFAKVDAAAADDEPAMVTGAFARLEAERQARLNGSP